MKLQQLKEGKVKLFAYGGKPWNADVFFNPEAEVTRDLSVAAVQAWQRMNKEKLTVCDALAGSGCRGLRYAKEVNGLKSVLLNDFNPVSARLIKKNIALNKLGRLCKASRCDANVLLSGKMFGIVDIDPFGPPVPFLDSAARSVLWNGMLAVTATDTSGLAGTYPETCLRKYGIRSMKTDYYAELGMRILISSIISTCAHHERGFMPLFSFATTHYYRVFGTVENNRSAADDALRQFGYVSHCFKCGNRVIGRSETCGHCESPMRTAGPLWLGRLNDKAFFQAVMADVGKRKFRLAQQDMKLLQLIEQETELPPFYYNLHEIARMNKTAIPRIEKLIGELQRKGFAAGRTHFCPTAVKTDAKFDVLLEILRTEPLR